MLPFGVDHCLSTVAYLDPLLYIPTLCSELTDLLNNIRTPNNLAKYDMHVIEPRSPHTGDVELGGVSVLVPHVCHHHLEGLVMLVFEVFIYEVLSIDRLSSCTILMGNIACLYHKVGYDPVEDVPLVVEIFTT